jgi:hypothetical protein
MPFEIVGEITQVETIAVAGGSAISLGFGGCTDGVVGGN